ncbi:MAG: cation:dicarboxylase symporter family transporter [Cyanobacteria bacterium P01_E01_bin.42]
MTATNSFFLKQVPSLLQNSWLLIAALTVGLIIGIQRPELGQQIAPVGHLYLSLLKMCVLPILISGIILSIARLIYQSNSKQYAWQILKTFLLMLGTVSIGGALATSILEPGRRLNSDTLRNLGILIDNASQDLKIPLWENIPIDTTPSPLATFLTNIIPENIFSALAGDQTLQTLFFSIIFGISLGVLHGEREIAAPLFKVLDNIYKSFNKIVVWLILFLPLGLSSLVASQIAQADTETIAIMAKFCLCGVLVFLLLYGLSAISIWTMSDYPWGKVVETLRGPGIVALVANNALVAMPMAIAALADALKFDRDISNTILPLAITLGRFGEVTYFTIATLFVVQLYDKPLTAQVIIIVLFGSIVAGIASSGSTGIVTLSALNIVLSPLNLPLESVLVLFLAVEPFMGPLRALCTLNTGILATSIIQFQPSFQEK